MAAEPQAALAPPEGDSSQPGVALTPAQARLEDQIAWYDAKSQHSQRWYKLLKAGQIVLAALVPVLATTDVPRWTLGGIGALVVILEGFQQLFQYQQNWITYRSTCEALRHEKYLFESQAGPYGAAVRPEALLAEHVEGLVSQEHAKWASSQEELAKGEGGQPSGGAARQR